MSRSGTLALHQPVSPQGGSCCVSGGSAPAGVKGHGAFSPASRTPSTGGNSLRKSPSSTATVRLESTRAATPTWQLVRSHGIPVVALSSQRFRRERGASRFAEVREAYDDETLSLLDGHAADLHVTAGYGLIFGAAMARSRPALNLHPASPDGPVGTWQQVIWQLIESRAEESGAFTHLATEDLDRGPVVTYVTFPIRGGDFDGLWAQAEASSVVRVAGDAWRGNPAFPGHPCRTGRRAREAAAAGDAEGARRGPDAGRWSGRG